MDEEGKEKDLWEYSQLGNETLLLFYACHYS